MKKGKDKSMQTCDSCRWYRKNEVIECFCFELEDWNPYPDGRCQLYDDGCKAMNKDHRARRTGRKDEGSSGKM